MARMIDDNIKRQLSKRMDFFLKYFPVRVRNVGEDAVAARQLIWAFKDARDNAQLLEKQGVYYRLWNQLPAEDGE